MPLIDLSLVTTTLLRLLRARVDVLWAGFFPPSPPDPPPPVVGYSGVASGALTGDQALGLFLYHVTEDAHFKNLPPVYQDKPPIRFTPMPLQLHYQLVAHAGDMGGADAAALRSQRLFGLALKTLHDYPSIDRTTQVAGTFAFPPELQGTDNVFRVVLKSVAPAEATNFWTAGTQAVRLAAYYEVSVALLEPDRPQTFSGRVLRYGVQLFVNGAPRLDTSRSTVLFRLPAETSDRTVDVQPADVAIGETLRFEGVDLSGDTTTLLINKGSWDAPEEVGIDWGVAAGTDAIVARVGTRAGEQDILPGIHSVAARVTRKRTMPDGSIRAFPQTSNEVPFTVAPAVTTPAHNVVAAAVANIVTVTGGPFDHADILPENVHVIIGAEPVPLEPAAALTAGHFEIVSATQLRIQFPIAGLTAGETLPLRVLVNGAECAPRWVQVP